MIFAANFLRDTTYQTKDFFIPRFLRVLIKCFFYLFWHDHVVFHFCSHIVINFTNWFSNVAFLEQTPFGRGVLFLYISGFTVLVFCPRFLNCLIFGLSSPFIVNVTVESWSHSWVFHSFHFLFVPLILLFCLFWNKPSTLYYPSFSLPC